MTTTTPMLDLPPADEMWDAVLARDPAFDGIFFTAVRTTGIFCRPSCPARKPNRENVEFLGSARDALFSGYRPCRRCRPMEIGEPPAWVRRLVREVESRPDERLADADLREMGVDPARARRWFQANHGMTFHAWQRGMRLGRALAALGDGEDIAATAYQNGFESLSGFGAAIERLTGEPPGRSRSARVVRLRRIATPLGPMVAGATDDALCLLEFADRRMLEAQMRTLGRRLDRVYVPGTSDVLARVETELGEYFVGERDAFDVPLETPGTDFQRAVWDGLREIPFGETRSYAEQARRLGRPSAVRAVARANGANRIAIAVPCHRVVGSDGRLTGYGGGLWRKRWLLDLERGAGGNDAA